MDPRFAQFPKALASQARIVRLQPGGIPALLAHPDWSTPRPTMIWLHGRTVNKELDPGRYLRWIRAGIAACAIDLPGHGERSEPRLQQAAHSPELLRLGRADVDPVVEALASPEFGGVFDLDRLGLGGMSAGGMITLRRLCDPHPFKAAAVECTTGWMSAMYFPEKHGMGARPAGWPTHDPEEIKELDAAEHLAGWKPIPLLTLHSEADRVVPWATMTGFLEKLRERYRSAGADPAMIETVTWPQTGAPEEHNGFGLKSNDAKNAQTEFLGRVL